MWTPRNKGAKREERDSLQLMAGYDDEEDYTITGSNKDLTTGNLTSGNARSDFHCRGIHNFGAAAATVKYVLLDDATATTRTCIINSGNTFAPTPPLKTIVVSGSTASATIKLLYWDILNSKGDGPVGR